MNIKELTYYIQSANINFLIGSGASRLFLPTLGSIETWPTKLNEDRKSAKADIKYKIAEASISKVFYETVIASNKFNSSSAEYYQTKGNYRSFLTIWNNLLNKRHSRIFNKQINYSQQMLI